MFTRKVSCVFRKIKNADADLGSQRFTYPWLAGNAGLAKYANYFTSGGDIGFLQSLLSRGGFRF